jgi:hypothetical protein
MGVNLVLASRSPPFFPARRDRRGAEHVPVVAAAPVGYLLFPHRDNLSPATALDSRTPLRPMRCFHKSRLRYNSYTTPSPVTMT